MPTLYWGPWLAKIRRGGPDIACNVQPIIIMKWLTIQKSVKYVLLSRYK